MNLTWLEEPIYPPEDYQTLAKLNKELGIPWRVEKTLVLNMNLNR